MEALWTLLKSSGVAVGLMVGVTVVMLLVFTWWIRHTAKGRQYLYILEENRQVTTMIAKVVNSRVEIVGPDGDPEAYVVSPEKCLWTFWPTGVPKFMSVPVPSNIYVRDRCEPVDPYPISSRQLVTANSLAYLTDEAVVKQTWKDAKEQLGLKAGKPSMGQLILYLLLGVLLIVSIYTIIKVQGLSGDVNVLTDALVGATGGK